MVVRSTAKKTATKKQVTTAKKPAPVAAKPVARKVEAAEEKVTAYDVVRAMRAHERAKQELFRLNLAFWAQNDDDIQDAAAAAERAVEEMTPPKRTGRKPAETPSQQAKAAHPVIGEYYDLDKVKAMGVTAIRELANDLADKDLITERKLKAEIIKQMEKAGLFRSAGSDPADEDDSVDDDEDASEDEEELEDDEDSDDDEDDSDESDDDESDEEDDGDDEDDEDGYTIADLKAMKLKALQDFAEQNEIDVDGMSKAEIIEALLSDAEGDDEDEDEPEDEDDEDETDEDEDEEETIEIDLADLKKYGVDELYALAKDQEIKIPVARRKDKKFLIAKIEAHFSDDDE
jgi:hypothetical protein